MSGHSFRCFLRVVAALAVMAGAWASWTSNALAHLGENKPQIETKKRAAAPRPGPHGRAEISLPGGGTTLTLQREGAASVGSFDLRNVGDGPLEIFRIGFEVEEGAPRVPSGLGITRDSKQLRPGETRRYTVTWQQTSAAKQLHGFLVVESDGAAAGATTFDAPVSIAVVGDRRPLSLRRILTVVALAPLLLTLLALFARRVPGLNDRVLRGAGISLASLVAALGLVPLVTFSRSLGREDGNWGLQHLERGRLFGEVEYFAGADGLTIALLPAVGAILVAIIVAVQSPRRGLPGFLGLSGVIASSLTFFLISQSLVVSAVAFAVLCFASALLLVRSIGTDSARGRAVIAKLALVLSVALAAFAFFAYRLAHDAFPGRLLDGTVSQLTLAVPEIAREAAHGHAVVGGAARVLGLPAEHGLLLLLLIAFGAIGAIAPLHGWVADTLGEAEPAAAALVIGVTSLVSGAGLLRFGVALFPQGMGWAASSGLFVLALVTLVLGAARALVEDDARRVVGHLSVASSGFLLASLATLTPQGFQGALALVLCRSIALPLGVLVVGTVVRRTGSASLARGGGLSSATPLLGVAWLVAIAAMAQLPGGGATWPLFLCLLAMAGKVPLLALALAFGLFLVAAAAARALRPLASALPGWWRDSAHLEPHGGTLPDLRRDELAWAMLLIAALLVLTLAPRWWLGVSDKAILDVFRAIEAPGPTQVS